MRRKKPHIEQQESIFLCYRAEKDTCEWMPKGKTHASFWPDCCNTPFLAIIENSRVKVSGRATSLVLQVFFLGHSSSCCIYGMYSLTNYLTKTRGTLAIVDW